MTGDIRAEQEKVQRDLERARASVDQLGDVLDHPLCSCRGKCPRRVTDEMVERAAHALEGAHPADLDEARVDARAALEAALGPGPATPLGVYIKARSEDREDSLTLEQLEAAYEDATLGWQEEIHLVIWKREHPEML